MKFCLILTIVVHFIAITFASSGDQNQIFQSCLSACKASSKCSLDPPKLPLFLRLTVWSCDDNCKYNCMHEITTNNVAKGEKIEQYYGKWPFIRFLGIQEPASTLFSILNGYMHYRHWNVLKRYLSDTYWLKPYLLGWCLLGINSWIWSTIFHTRDFPITEKLDYFSAGASVMYALHCGLLQVFEIQNRSFRKIWAIVSLILFLLHISYLSFIRFDYGYNMLANIIIGLLNNSLWIGWTIYHWKDRSFAWMPAFCVVAISTAMSLEILDFSPIFYLIDAHSLWHFSTIWLIPIWYRFQLKEAKYQDAMAWAKVSGKGVTYNNNSKN